MDISLAKSSSYPQPRLQMRTKIVLVAAAWWLFLAVLSRIELSSLQQVWILDAWLAIFIYFPICIIAGGWIAAALSKRIHLDERNVTSRFPLTEKIFYALMLIFLLQCLVFLPPALSDSPNDARLEWGLPFVHVITEITIRVMCLIVIGNACVRKKLLARDRWILAICLIYTVLVVSRSFMLEIIFYCGFASIAASAGQRGYHKRLFKSLLLVLLIVGIFIGYGNWRQGSDFSIVEYAELVVDSNTLAWIFGYFLVNFDNLALLINEQYRNEAVSNIFGSILQTLQIAKFDQVDNYLYVGKFNLGTAFRPFVLDFGILAGGAMFLLLWAMVLLAPSLSQRPASRYAIYALIAYSAFCFPITSRIEQPPYLFALIWILIADRTAFSRHLPAA